MSSLIIGNFKIPNESNDRNVEKPENVSFLDRIKTTSKLIQDILFFRAIKITPLNLNANYSFPYTASKTEYHDLVSAINCSMFLSNIITLPLLLIEYLITPLPTIMQHSIFRLTTSLRLFLTLFLLSSINLLIQALSIIPNLMIFALAKVASLVIFIIDIPCYILTMPVIATQSTLERIKKYNVNILFKPIIFTLELVLSLLVIFCFAPFYIFAYLVSTISRFNNQILISGSVSYSLAKRHLPHWVQYDEANNQPLAFWDVLQLIESIARSLVILLWRPLANLFTGNHTLTSEEISNNFKEIDELLQDNRITGTKTDKPLNQPSPLFNNELSDDNSNRKRQPRSELKAYK
ncbi:MAG: hypothetical protein ACON5A_00085 [Candidatus Comchoanobacterales bacterium]